MNKKTLLISLLSIPFFEAAAQQVDVSADMRFRYEHRNGYGGLLPDTAKAADFVVQRSRIIIDYTSPQLKLRISPQSVRIWGDVATNAKTDAAFQMHEAWAEVSFRQKWALRAGRQEFNYDDARILGNVDWTMQARSHDAVLLQYKPSAMHTFHAAAALNANRESNSKEPYTVPQYRYLQFGWYHGQRNHLAWSLLFLNHGIPYLREQHEKTAWNQTFGPRITFQQNAFSADAAFYAQTGGLAGETLNAWYCSGNLSYKFAKGWQTGAGFEYLSGKAGDDASPSYKSFTPWFGTNHKFNGYMDYFYVGNHLNSVGLTDLYGNLSYEKPAFKARLTPHFFSSAAPLFADGQKLKSYLGTELDLTVGFSIIDFVWLNGGCSQMFATSTMERLKGVSNATSGNWMFLELQINPKLFTIKTVRKSE
ncbi:alginate export family protein [Chitinophaga sp. HK235]|uniref:alginate export family protein n=1 Tax=Chitinophaga sp. HK235 TaxID=2952571 RepID=UPI001BA5F2FF|nr:alginate export family protein [Chitinophaga sp. HK235]